MIPPGTRVVYIGCNHTCECHREANPYWWRPYGTRGVVAQDQLDQDAHCVAVEFDGVRGAIGTITKHLITEEQFNQPDARPYRFAVGDIVVYIGHGPRCPHGCPAWDFAPPIGICLPVCRLEQNREHNFVYTEYWQTDSGRMRQLPLLEEHLVTSSEYAAMILSGEAARCH